MNIKLNKSTSIPNTFSGLNNNNNKISLGCSKNGYVAFLISLSYKINTIIGGQFLNLKNSYSKEGSITYINRLVDEPNKEETGNDINKFDNNEYKSRYRYDDLIPEEEKNRSKIKFIGPIESMKKYCNEKWKQFFKEVISERIKLYENKLCLKGKIENNDFRKCNIDIDGNILENMNTSNKQEMEFKDMEINLNEFNFLEIPKVEKNRPIKVFNKPNNKNKENKKEENNLVKSIQLNHQRMMVDEIDFADNNQKESANVWNDLKNSAVINDRHRYFNIK